MADYSHLYMFPGGTPTLGARELDVTREKYQSDALAEAVRLREAAKNNKLQHQYQMGMLNETIRNNDMQNNYQMRTAANNEILSGSTGTTFDPFGGTSTTFGPVGGTSDTQKTRKYTIQRLDDYIKGVRNTQKNPDAVMNFIKNNTRLDPNFRQAVLERLDAHIIYD